MSTEATLEKTKRLLEKHNQSHLLAFWDQLNQAQRESLLAQIEELDFARIDDWVADIVKRPASQVPQRALMPAPSYPPEPAGEEQKEKYKRAEQLGRELISAGKVAAFVVAGGQGTRLGFDGPKGAFPISPLKGKTLFQLFAETIAAVSDKYGCCCPWYIMTSPLNYQQSVDIFEQNGYYGLDRKNVFFFKQGTLPNFSFEGKLLLADKATIACSPDGHGGSLKALHKSGALEDMKRRGIEYISYFQVDNPLVRIFDPLFIGLHVLDEAEMSSKALIKAYPEEKVGVFCLVEGKVHVIEYSDLPEELARKQNSNGSLVYSLGSIAIHLINVSFVEKLNHAGFSLPLHRAVKKVPYIDINGNRIDPAEPNAVKLERFVFDALPLARNSVVLQTRRSEEFAPVKNATGTDSPQTAKDMIVRRAADWLEAAGINVPRKADGSPDCIIEIAPAFAVEREDIEAGKGRIPTIRPGDRIYLA